MKVLRIKWENISSILIVIFFLVVNTKAFIKAGFNFDIFMFELVLDIGVIYIWHYILKNIRLSFLEERK